MNGSLIVTAEQEKSVLKVVCSRGQQRVCAMLALISGLRFSEGVWMMYPALQMWPGWRQGREQLCHP